MDNFCYNYYYIIIKNIKKTFQPKNMMDYCNKKIIIIILLINTHIVIKGMHVKSIITRPHIQKVRFSLRRVLTGHPTNRFYGFLDKLFPGQKKMTPLSTTDDTSRIAENLVDLNKKMDAIAIFLLKNKAEILVTSMRTSILNGKYPNNSEVCEYTNTTETLEKEYKIHYNPLDIKMNSGNSILKTLLIVNIESFLNKISNPITTSFYNLNKIIEMRTKINDQDKKILQKILIKQFQNVQIITEDELQRIRSVLSLLDYLDKSTHKQNTINEFMAKYTQPLQRSTSNVIDDRESQEAQLQPKDTNIKEDPILNELYELETLNYIMDQYEQTVEANPHHKILPHFQKALDSATKSGFNDKATRKAALLQLRQKAKELTPSNSSE